MICLNVFKNGISKKKEIFEKCENSDLMSRLAMYNMAGRLLIK